MTSHAATPSLEPDDHTRPVTLTRAVTYGSGEAAFSLVMNGLYGFALLFYTEAMGLSPALAGLALSLSVFWEALTEPLMGHVSDRTRTRFGSRMPWIVLGALLLAVSFYSVWTVPEVFRTRELTLFVYLLMVNLALRTALTIFFIPYLALGFEIARTYDGRTYLQGVRQVCNMAANLAGPALAWTLFFPDVIGPTGATVSGTSDASNYPVMGAAFAVALLALTALLVFSLRDTARDNRSDPLPSEGQKGVTAFWSSMRPVVHDPLARHVFVLILLLVLGMVVVSSIQSYLYVHFMNFTGIEKTIVHGSTMVAAAAGGILAPILTRRLDKKGAMIAGSIIAIVGQIVLAALFLPNLLPRDGLLSTGLFMFGQGLYWIASGIVLPVATAMIADVADLARARTGKAAEGTYASLFSLAWRVATSISLLIAGVLLGFAGVGKAEAVVTDGGFRLLAIYTSVGACAYVVCIAWTTRYQLTRARFETQKAASLASAQGD